MQTQPVNTHNLQHLNQPNPHPLVLDKATPVHFIGAGGVGMSALAKVLLAQGFPVSGSDAKDGPYLQMLQELGATTYVSHEAAHVPKNAVVVASSAITMNNPEAQAAQSQGLPIFHRSDLLREILRQFDVAIGLTGTHGKTSMTGMTGLVLEAGGLDPTIIAGGKIPGLGTNAKTGKDTRFAVAELDESDGTVVQYRPQISVIANLELDHPDHYQGGLEAVKDTFSRYLSQLDRTCKVLFNMDCPVTRELWKQHGHLVESLKVYTLTVPEDPDEKTYFVQNVMTHLEGAYQAELYRGYDCLGTIWLQVPGRHNLSNAMMAAIIGYLQDIPFDDIRRALENFTGMGRRFERLGTVNGALVVDDYAHHPTEVQATLKGAREYNQHRGRVIAMFQPHRYHRLQTLWDDFVQSFEDADEVIIADVYGAGEAPIDGISGKALADAIDHPAVEYWPSADWELVVARLKAMLTKDDLLITMGAGDITRVGRLLVGSEG